MNFYLNKVLEAEGEVPQMALEAEVEVPQMALEAEVDLEVRLFTSA